MTETMTQQEAGYKLTAADADLLKGIVGLPHEFRVEALEKLIQKDRGRLGLAMLFSQFIGMCLSVEANARDFVELLMITEAHWYPQQAEKLNLPTVFGALCGVGVAITPVPGMCNGCAFRLGTHANQSPCTASDADWSADGATRFMCHHELDENDEPTRICAGYANLKSRREAAFADAERKEKRG